MAARTWAIEAHERAAKTLVQLPSCLGRTVPGTYLAELVDMSRNQKYSRTDDKDTPPDPEQDREPPPQRQPRSELDDQGNEEQRSRKLEEAGDEDGTGEDDRMEELDRDDLKDMEGPDA